VVKIKNLSRQDKNGVRTAADLERRYKFNQIELTKEEIDELKKSIITDKHLSATSTNPIQNATVTQALNSKVNEEANKGLSTNDFTDKLKNKLEGISSTGNYAEYSDYIRTTENVSVIPIEYDEYSEGNIVDVYVNGYKLIRNLHYSISESNIVLTNEIDDIGTEIEIIIK
jgi:hypothetical protein